MRYYCYISWFLMMVSSTTASNAIADAGSLGQESTNVGALAGLYARNGVNLDGGNLAAQASNILGTTSASILWRSSLNASTLGTKSVDSQDHDETRYSLDKPGIGRQAPHK